MKTMEQQFDAIMQPRFQKLGENVAVPAGELLEKRMHQNTEQGTGFGNDEYNNTYSLGHTRERKKRGYQTSNVDLRMANRRIETTRTRKETNESAKITFDEGGDIFKLHHTGRAKGKKVRSIWPKTPKSVPSDLRERFKRKVTEVLRGIE